MLVRTRTTHECETTFVGPNPFVAAIPWQKIYKPATRAAGLPCITQNDILGALRDGRPRTIAEVADALDGDEGNIGRTLAKMAKTGIIKRGMRALPGKKSVPEYSVWDAV